MNAGKKRQVARDIRKERVRRKIRVRASRPRLSIFRSNRHLYAQIVDDTIQKTLVAASTRSKELKGALKKTNDLQAAQEVGKLLAKKAVEKQLSEVCFDRGPYLFHGRVKALADAARSAGLKF